jgi:hypothetical protein
MAPAAVPLQDEPGVVAEHSLADDLGHVDIPRPSSL